MHVAYAKTPPWAQWILPGAPRRVLARAPWPLIAPVVYLAGRDYDPASEQTRAILSRANENQLSTLPPQPDRRAQALDRAQHLQQTSAHHSLAPRSSHGASRDVLDQNRGPASSRAPVDDELRPASLCFNVRTEDASSRRAMLMKGCKQCQGRGHYAAECPSTIGATTLCYT